MSDFLGPRELVPKEAYSKVSNTILMKTESWSFATLDDQWGYIEHFFLKHHRYISNFERIKIDSVEMVIALYTCSIPTGACAL